MTEDTTATMGHNLPDADADPLKDRLYEDHADKFTRKAELLEGLASVPDRIEDGDEATAGRLTDFIKKQIAEFRKSVNTTHEAEKAPFLAAGRTVDSFKHVLLDDIDKGGAAATVVLKSYADRKAAIEKAAREKAEREARAAAVEAQRKADAEAAERARVAAEAKRIADEAKAAEDAKVAEAQRQADEAAKAVKDEEDIAAALVVQEEADRVKRNADAKALIAKREAERVAAEDAAKQKLVDEEAKRTEAAAIKAGRAADAKPAELGKSRGELGGQTSLKQFWNYTDLDRDRIDLESLRDHFTHDAIEKALKSWINVNAVALEQGKELAGVRLFSDTRL